MIKNICAIFVPLIYKRSCSYGISAKTYSEYARQKIALQIEQHCIENTIDKYILNLHGFPSLDTADFLIHLRQIYPHIFLEFIQDSTNRYISNSEYQQKHQFLLAQADKKILVSDTSMHLHQKYIIQHYLPAYYTYPCITAKYILTFDTSRLSNKIINLAQRDNKIVNSIAFCI